MLQESGAEYQYREYTEEPLSRDELKEIFGKLGMSPHALLRTRDAKKLGVPADASDEELIGLMAEHPTLLQRPILVKGKRAVLGRPVENLEKLL
ncbi:MAG TPA: arsenate reductase (glutaredoxin) [Planctomycetes bacterium]|nr:arsenate reductase (glutaredoxin) [Planctomycetota bacterium]